jgi:methylated-DNA-[protein]-cysteine S-methyltransferase
MKRRAADAPSMTAYARFATAIGDCGIAWGEHGVVGLWLPRTNGSLPAATVLRRWPDALEAPMPPELRAGVQQIVDLLAGRAKPTLDDMNLDFSGIGEFDARVYSAARRIAPGSTATYGELAKQLGDAGEARAVGQALGRNPFPIVVPCHRVLAAQGKAGGFSAPGGLIAKHRLLQIEGALPPSLFDVAPK